MELQDILSSQKTIERDVMLASGKHIVVTSSKSSQQYAFNEITDFLKQRVSSVASDSENYWIDFQALDEHEISVVCSILGIHPLTKRDIIQQETREKCEFFSKHIFIVVNEIHYAEGSNNLISGTLSIILFQNLCLTFHSQTLLCTSQVVRMIKYSETGALSSSAWIIYAFLESIVDLYVDLVDNIMLETESLDELVLILSGMKQNELFARIGLAGRRVTNLHSGIFEKSEIISVLLRDDKLIPTALRGYLKNVQDCVVRMTQKLNLCRRLLGDLNNMYMARVSLEVSDSSNMININMRKFTAISTIFIPLILVTGIFGMNVKYPGMIDSETQGDSYNFFIVLISMMVAFAGIVAFLFRRAGWL